MTSGLGTIDREHLAFHAMGTATEVLVVGGEPGLAELARQRVAQLEARWSRFLPTSDIARLNEAEGRCLRVSPDTIVLVDRALAAARATGGLFDPTIGAALVAHGYDRDLTAARRSARAVHPVPVVDGSWPAIEVDAAAGTVCLPEGVHLDPGAIGKGLAADLVTAELEGRAEGILVNVGGDLRVRGRAGSTDGWVVSIDDPFLEGGELTRLALAEGGVATSSRLRRRWETAEGPAHHVFDPRTGRPAATDVVAVTVVAADAWWAEVQATSLFLLGPDALADLDETVHALVVTEDGRTVASAGLEAVLG